MKREKLPKQWQGADVVRAVPMDGDKCDVLVEEHACSEWDARSPMFVVVDDTSIEDRPFDFKVFKSKAKALRYAKACGNGNMDQRVLTVTAQTLIVATDNDL